MAKYSYLAEDTVIEIFKICKTCGLSKPSADYFIDSRGKNGLVANCKNCDLSRRKEWREKGRLLGKFGKCSLCQEPFGAGNPRKTGLCRNCNVGELSSHWKGGSISVHGYRVIRNGTKHQIGEHRIVMERYLGRKLYEAETVHHKNGIRTDNRIENLELWVKPHGTGIRVKDAIAWANEILDRYT